MKTSELTGAQLDYWVARAEGIPAEQLTIRRVQRSTECHVVREWVRDDPIIGHDIVVLSPSTNWGQGGPLIEKHGFSLLRWEDATAQWWNADHNGCSHYLDVYRSDYEEDGSPTPLQAICRAVVRAAFGDEVEEVAVCP